MTESLKVKSGPISLFSVKVRPDFRSGDIPCGLNPLDGKHPEARNCSESLALDQISERSKHQTHLKAG